jgi:UDP-N-acetylmuramyl pentapeptide synthase
MLAQIEQAQKILNAVHKRLHTSQAQEFALICECFKGNPRVVLAEKSSPRLSFG